MNAAIGQQTDLAGRQCRADRVAVVCSGTSQGTAGRRDEQALIQVNQRQAAMSDSPETVLNEMHGLFPT